MDSNETFGHTSRCRRCGVAFLRGCREMDNGAGYLRRWWRVAHESGSASGNPAWLTAELRIDSPANGELQRTKISLASPVGSSPLNSKCGQPRTSRPKWRRQEKQLEENCFYS